MDERNCGKNANQNGLVSLIEKLVEASKHENRSPPEQTSEPIKWLGATQPDKKGEEFRILTNMLRDNDYSKVVDLEDEFFEIDRYAIYGNFQRGPNGIFISYLEVDKRCPMSPQEIIVKPEQVMQRTSTAIFDKEFLKVNRHYMRHIIVLQGQILSDIAHGRGDLQKDNITPIATEYDYEEKFIYGKFSCTLTKTIRMQVFKSPSDKNGRFSCWEWSEDR